MQILNVKPHLVEAKDFITIDNTAVVYSDSVLLDTVYPITDNNIYTNINFKI